MKLGDFKKKLLLLLLIIALLCEFAEAGIISGTINSQKDSIASFAVVAVKETGISVQADAAGHYKIAGLKAGQYTLSFFYASHQKQEQKVYLKTDNDSIKLNVRLLALSSEIGEVVVSGTMKETYLSESPVHVEILTPKLFQKNPSPGIFDALQMVNGVRPQINCNVCNTGDIHINGMEGPYTMVLIDGMPIVSALSTVYGLSGIPNSLVERIEIVKGPASTLYGSEAVAGLINIITKDPQFAPRYSIDFFSSSQWEKNLDLGYTFKRKKFQSLISANLFHFNKRLDINNDNFTDVTLQQRISVFSKSSIELGRNRKLSIAARYFYEDRFGGEMQWERKYRAGDSVYGESIFTKRIELMAHMPVWKNGNLSFSYNKHDQNSAYGQTMFLATQQVAFLQYSHSKRISLKHEILSGLTYRYTYYDDNTVVTQTADSVPGNKASRTSLPGLFIQEEYATNEKLKILTGARLDHHNRHGLIFSPRINIKYDLNKLNTFRLALGNGYRVVNLFTEEHSALTGSRKVIIKNELKAEQSWNATLNYTSQINYKNGFVSLDLAGFYTYFTNKIAADYFTDPNSIIYDNLDGYAITKGVSFNSNFHFKHPFKITLGSTLMDVYLMENEKRQTQVQAPSITGNFLISYTFKKSGISLDYSGNVTGPMKLPVLANDFRPEKSPWHSIQNLQLSWKASKTVTIYGGAKNLLNFVPKHPLMRPFDPFDKEVNINNPNGYTFDTSYNYAAIQGLRGFAGIRCVIN